MTAPTMTRADDGLLTFQIVWLNDLGHPVATTQLRKRNLTLALKAAGWMIVKGREPAEARGFLVSQVRR